MVKYTGAYESETGTAHCSSCGAPQAKWEMTSVSADNGNLLYAFKCKKCQKRITMRISPN